MKKHLKFWMVKLLLSIHMEYKMPVQKTTKDGKPAYKWGKSGKPYTYTPGNKTSRERAKKLAVKQGRAIKSKK